MNAPNRKMKPILTLIPEEERAIAYRFSVVLVGANAHDYARQAVTSEMAEAYKPKSKTKAKQAEDLGQISEDGPQGAELQPGRKGNAQQPGHEDKLVLFCPTGPNNKELARILLQPVCGFSDSLPFTKDEATAKYQIVVLLFWNVEKDASSTSSTITEWYSRIAEINHQPSNLRPYTIVLAYEPDSEQERSLNEFTGKYKGVAPATVIHDGSEDGITESLQDLAELCIGRLKRNERSSSIVLNSGDLPSDKARFCVIS